MGKMPEAPSPPTFKPSETYEDDKLVSAQYLEGGKIINKMISTAEEKENKQRREDDIKSLEEDISAFRPKLNTLEPEFQADINKEAQAMSSQAQEGFKSQFQPLMRDIQEESAKKFGTLQSSFYENERDKLMGLAAQTEGQIATDIEGRKAQLRKDELSNRQNYVDSLTKQLGYLQQGVNDFYNQQNQRYEQNLKASDLYNNWEMNKYYGQLDAYKAQLQYKSQKRASIMGMFSDIRLKEGIRPIKNALKSVCNLSGYDYNWKGTDSDAKGVIAQELENVFPELVTEESGFKKVDYAGLVPVLIEAIKELKEKVDGQNRLNTNESNARPKYTGPRYGFPAPSGPTRS